MRRLGFALLLAAALALPSRAAADDAAVAGTLVTFSIRFAADGAALAALKPDDPLATVVRRATRFRGSALRARTALVNEPPSSAEGRRIRRLGVDAFTGFARAAEQIVQAARAEASGRDDESRRLQASAERLAARAASDLGTAGKLVEKLIPA